MAIDRLTGKHLADLTPFELLAHLRDLPGRGTPDLDRAIRETEPRDLNRRADSGGDWHGPNYGYSPDLEGRPGREGPGGRGPGDELILDHLEWHDVSSSNVRRIAYLVDFHRLFVEFHSGAIYAYEGFEPSRWDDFLASDSKGMFVFYILRNNGSDSNTYAYRQIRAGYRAKTVRAAGRNLG